MMAPFFKFGVFGDETSLVIAFLIGIGFGFFARARRLRQRAQARCRSST